MTANGPPAADPPFITAAPRSAQIGRGFVRPGPGRPPL